MKKFLLKYFEENLIEQVLKSKKYKRIYGITKSPKLKRDKIDINVCKTLYEKYSLPIYKIAMLYGVSDATLRTHLINNNITLKGHNVGKNSFNKYFSTIDTIDKAYYLGLIVADGSLNSSNNKKNLQISLTGEDKYILERFNKYADFNTNLIISHKEDKKPRYLLSIHSPQIYDDLVKLKVEERKSQKETYMPDLKKDLIPHFIRGYFDGDGIAKSNGYVGFCGSHSLLKQIRKFLVIKYGFKNNSITYNKSNNIFYIQWASKRDRQKFFEVIYKDKKDLFLIRKYNKIKNNL